MRYLTDRRAAVRDDPRHLLPSARSVICVGKLYNAPWPYSTQFDDDELRLDLALRLGRRLSRRAAARPGATGDRLRERAGAPSSRRSASIPRRCSERSYARLAGLGWIGKNTCLINQQSGSWFFLGELLVSLEIDARRAAARPLRHLPPLHRCLPDRGDRAASGGGYTLDSRLCISYFTIELRGADSRRACAPASADTFSAATSARTSAPGTAARRSPRDPAFAPRHFAPPLGGTGGAHGDRIPRDVPRHAGHARALCRVPAQRGRRHGQPRLAAVSRAAGKAGGVARPRGGGARPLGARKMSAGSVRLFFCAQLIPWWA